jgi:hypothetical protein
VKQYLTITAVERGTRYKAVPDQWELEHTVINWLKKGWSPYIWAKHTACKFRVFISEDGNTMKNNQPLHM